MIDITGAEWKVMECLWAKSPKTVRELTEELEETTAWKRHTVINFLNRLMAKGAVLRKGDSLSMNMSLWLAGRKLSGARQKIAFG